MSGTDILPLDILARVTAVSREVPRIDRAVIQAAIQAHLARDVRVAKNAEEGYLLAQERVELAGWARAATRKLAQGSRVPAGFPRGGAAARPDR